MQARRIAILVSCVVTLLSAGRVAAQGKPKLPLGLDADSAFVPADNPMTPDKQRHRGLRELSPARTRLERSPPVLDQLCR